MERLTERHDDSVGYYVKAINNTCDKVCFSQILCENCPIGKAFNKLATYEDTGLEPDEIAALKAENERLQHQIRGYDDLVGKGQYALEDLRESLRHQYAENERLRKEIDRLTADNADLREKLKIASTGNYPLKHERTLVGDYRCPSCNAAFIEGAWRTPFCGNCGQKLAMRSDCK